VKALILRFRLKVADPVITDRSVDLMAIWFWFCYAGWGITSAIVGLPTIAKASTPIYELIWGASIGLTATVALVAAVLTFATASTVKVRIRKKVVEQTAVSVLGGFVAVYPIFIILLAIGGDSGRVATVFTATVFLIFPTWRVRHLGQRIRKLREHV
jgi:hypothetical protein